MQVPKYSPPQSSLSTRSDRRVLAANLLLTPWHGPRCSKCHQSHISYRRQPWNRNPAAYHSPTPFLWYFVLAVIHERRRKSSIFWAIWACKLVCLLDLILEKDRETWLPTCNSAWFWGIGYLAKLSHPLNSFRAWPPCLGSIFKALVHGVGFASKRSSTLKARRIVLPRFLILSKDQDLPYRKRKDGICN